MDILICSVIIVGFLSFVVGLINKNKILTFVGSILILVIIATYILEQPTNTKLSHGVITFLFFPNF